MNEVKELSREKCCIHDRFESNVGYVLYSLLSRVRECFIAVVCCIDDYALSVIDQLIAPSARALIFYSKRTRLGHSVDYKPGRAILIRFENHFKHYLFDSDVAAKGTVNLTYWELEPQGMEELEVEYLRCNNINECNVFRSVVEKIRLALRSRPEVHEEIRGTNCGKLLAKIIKGI